MFLATLLFQTNSRLVGPDINPLGITAHALYELLGRTLSPNDKLSVPSLKYFKKLRMLLTVMTDFEIANYLVFRRVISMARSTSPRARQTLNDWDNALNGMPIGPPRWEFCTGTVIRFFGAKVSQIYKNMVDGTTIREQTIGMFKHSHFVDRSAICNFVGSSLKLLLSAYLVVFSKIFIIVDGVIEQTIII